MQIIKFRVWDSLNKKMYPHHLIDFNSIFSKHPPMGDRIMQYTGHNTFNGKEIYDGDILWGTDSTGGGAESVDYTIRSIVSWDSKWGRWIVTEVGSEDVFELYDYSLMDNVIGNIYENPELAQI